MKFWNWSRGRSRRTLPRFGSIPVIGRGGDCLSLMARDDNTQETMTIELTADEARDMYNRLGRVLDGALLPPR